LPTILRIRLTETRQPSGNINENAFDGIPPWPRAPPLRATTVKTTGARKRTGPNDSQNLTGALALLSDYRRDKLLEAVAIAAKELLRGAQFELSSDLDRTITKNLARFKIPPSRLELELTETVLMETT
jgi:hypothetical protein